MVAVLTFAGVNPGATQPPRAGPWLQVSMTPPGHALPRTPADEIRVGVATGYRQIGRAPCRGSLGLPEEGRVQKPGFCCTVGVSDRRDQGPHRGLTGRDGTQRRDQPPFVTDDQLQPEEQNNQPERLPDPEAVLRCPELSQSPLAGWPASVRA